MLYGRIYRQAVGHNILRKMFLFVLILSTINISCGEEKSTIGCVLENREVKRVYVGWPTKMSCHETQNLIIALRRHFYFSNDVVGNISCVIIDPVSNTTVWSEQMNKSHFRHSKAFYTSDITTASPRKYQVNIKPLNGPCYYNEITLEVTKQTIKTCDIDHKKPVAVEITRQIGQLTSMFCSAPIESEEQIDLQDGVHDYNVTWFRNCSQLHPEKHPDIYRVNGKELTVYKLDFKTVGIYSCSITYNGRTRHPVKISVCAKLPEYTSQATMQCPKAIKAKVGETVKIPCNVKVGEGVSHLSRMIGSWNKVSHINSFSCSNLGTRSTSGWQGRGRCFSTVSDVPNQKCYLYEPSIAKQEPINVIVTMALEIRDVQTKDFGKINVVYGDFIDSATTTVFLERHNGGDLSNYMIVVIVLSSIMGIVLFIALVLVARKTFKRCQT